MVIEEGTRRKRLQARGATGSRGGRGILPVKKSVEDRIRAKEFGEKVLQAYRTNKEIFADMEEYLNHPELLFRLDNARRKYAEVRELAGGIVTEIGHLSLARLRYIGRRANAAEARFKQAIDLEGTRINQFARQVSQGKKLKMSAFRQGLGEALDETFAELEQMFFASIFPVGPQMEAERNGFRFAQPPPPVWQFWK